jgi:hypothetical protein
MTHEPDLRRQARESIHEGRLPATPPARTWGGPGADTPCAVCGQLIRRSTLGFELEFEASFDSEPVHLQMHVPCFAAWELELEGPPANLSGNGASPRPLP